MSQIQDFKKVLLKHRPRVTIKSYTSAVIGCDCNKLYDGDDEKSWQEWAEHVAAVVYDSIDWDDV